MFMRRVLCRNLFTYVNSFQDGLNSCRTSYTCSLKEQSYSCDDFPYLNLLLLKVTSQTNPVKYNLSISISSELHALLSIQHQYELYQFLRRQTINKSLNEEIIYLVRDHGAIFDFPTVLKLINMYTWNSSVDGVEMMIQYAEASYPDDFIAQGKFLPHKTVCENMSRPMTVLTELLDKAPRYGWPKAVVAAQIELMLNKVIFCGSLCTVDKVNTFLAGNYCPELRGQVLCSSWVSFYLSPYENDLEVATRILKNNEIVMMPYLDVTLSRVAEYLLDGQQLNRYYALLQLFSKRSHHKKTERLLEMLFHHFYKLNNIRGCYACVSLARDLKLKLSADIMYKFEVLKNYKLVSSQHLDMTFKF